MRYSTEPLVRLAHTPRNEPREATEGGSRGSDALVDARRAYRHHALNQICESAQGRLVCLGSPTESRLRPLHGALPCL
jgi:hypothetical protein